MCISQRVTQFTKPVPRIVYFILCFIFYLFYDHECWSGRSRPHELSHGSRSVLSHQLTPCSFQCPMQSAPRPIMHNNSKAEGCDFCCFQVFVLLVLLSAGIYFWATKIRLDDSHLLVTGKRPNSVSTIGKGNVFFQFPTYVAINRTSFKITNIDSTLGLHFQDNGCVRQLKAKKFLGLKERSEKQNVQYNGNCMLLFRNP